MRRESTLGRARIASTSISRPSRRQSHRWSVRFSSSRYFLPSITTSYVIGSQLLVCISVRSFLYFNLVPRGGSHFSNWKPQCVSSREKCWHHFRRHLHPRLQAQQESRPQSRQLQLLSGRDFSLEFVRRSPLFVPACDRETPCPTSRHESHCRLKFCGTMKCWF